MNLNRTQLLWLHDSLYQLYGSCTESAVHYHFPHFYSSRTEANFEKQTSDVHSSHSHGLGKLFRAMRGCSAEENGWLT